MKVCYIAPIFDGTGYSHSAISHILALDQSGVTVVPRSVRMTNTNGEVSDRIKELAKNDLLGVDVVVQHNLPSEFCFKSGVHNVGLFSYETDSFLKSGWKHNLQLMDKIVVSCNNQIKSIENTGGQELAKKSYVLPHPVDTSKFDRDYDTMDFGVPKNCVKFYTIAEFGRRKNFAALISSYFREFSNLDNVLLIIKTHGPSSKKIEDVINEVKSGLGKFTRKERYPKIALITDFLKDSEVNSLHKTGDIFVSTSYGEAICLPFVDAIGFGNPAIAPKHTAFLDYAYEPHLLVDSSETNVMGVGNAPVGLYNSREKWGSISLLGLAEKMRWCYDNIGSLKGEAFAAARRRYIENFSYENSGKAFKAIINAK